MLAQINRFDEAERLVRVSAMLNPPNAALMPGLVEMKGKTRSP
jgi:hypothetical protein